MKSIFMFFTALAVFVSINSTSIAQLAPSWEKDLGTTIQWQKVTDYGYYIVHGGTNLYGLDPVTGETKWEIPNVGTLDESSYNKVKGTPYFTINSSNGNIMGFNPAKGKVLFDTEALGISDIEKLFPLIRNNSLMMIAKDGDESSMMVVDLETGKKLWSNTKEFGRLTGYTEINADEFIMTSFAYIYRINSNTGETVWKESIMGAGGAAANPLMGMLVESMGSALLGEEDLKLQFDENPFDKNMVLITAQVRNKSTDSQGNVKYSFSTKYIAFSKKDGMPYWEKPYETKGMIGSVYFMEDGLIVSPNASGKSKVNKLNYADGIGTWGKKGAGNSIKGGIIDYQMIDEGLLIVSSYDDQLKPDADLYVNLIDPSLGELKFDKPIKIKGGLEYTEVIDAGLLYKTNLEMNIINVATGETLFDKPIRSASPFFADNKDRSFSMPMAEKGDLIYTYSEKENAIFEINKNTGVAKEFVADIKFEGKEIPTSIELFEDGIVLSSDQNVLKAGFDGKIMYHSFYPAPSVSGFRKALLLAQAARAFYIGAAMKMSAVVFTSASANSENMVEEQILTGVGSAYDDVGAQAMDYGKDAISQLKERFKATQQNREYMFMMTEETKKEYSLLQVRKSDGQVSEKIIIGRDKDPNYAVDDISNKVFYAQDSHTIVCYSFE